MDDDPDIRTTLRVILEIEGYCVIEASDASQMYVALQNNQISLIILDLMLRDEDGLSILRDLHPSYNIPVIILTGKGDVLDKIIGLEVGADDYITKPFNNRELIARIKSILRRQIPKTPSLDILKKGIKAFSFLGWKLDTQSYTLTNPNGDYVQLTSHEYTVLHALIKSSGKVLSRDQLLNHLNNDTRDWSPGDRSLDILIAKLRKKMDDAPYTPKFIRTVRQAGYMFIAQVDTIDETQ